MKDDVKVPGVAWWILAATLIPVLQAWLMQAFPDSPFLWVPLVVGVLGGVAKWIEWLLRRNNAPEEAPAGEVVPMAAPMGEGMAPASRRRGVAWWLLG